VPVYNPLVFPCVLAPILLPLAATLYVFPFDPRVTRLKAWRRRARSTVVKLMRATCFHCHRIKMDSERVRTLHCSAVWFPPWACEESRPLPPRVLRPVAHDATWAGLRPLGWLHRGLTAA
jgi:hypothetical protein